MTEWVSEVDMTDKEKAAHPEFYVAQGYLKTIPYQEAFQASWDKADPSERIKVKDLPNFDADIFYEISGIDLRET